MKSTSDIGDTSLKDRLKQVIKHFAGTQVHFAEILGISQSTVASWVQRETLSYEAIILILKNCPNLSEQWLISGVGDMLIKQGYNLYYYSSDKPSLEMDFFVRDADSLIPVEVKSNDNATASLNNLLKEDKCPDVKYGIKLGYKNIGFNGKFYTFPYFLTFLLKRFVTERNK